VGDVVGDVEGAMRTCRRGCGHVVGDVWSEGAMDAVALVLIDRYIM
jgi:hypothetical protein